MENVKTFWYFFIISVFPGTAMGINNFLTLFKLAVPSGSFCSSPKYAIHRRL